MTKLERIIIESCDNGKITESERDELLSCLESTSLQRHQLKKYSELSKKSQSQYDKLDDNDDPEEFRKRRYQDMGKTQKDWTDTQNKMDEVQSDLKSLRYGKWNTEMGKRLGKKAKEFTKDKYESVEDVLKDILYAEACGDITPIEKDMLMESVNKKLDFITEK